MPTIGGTAATTTFGTNAQVRTARIVEIDFVKGTLVLIMVLYHWINYFIGLDWGGYRYLRFLTPSFICLTGFLIGRVYLQRYTYDDRRLHARLVWRGIKLLALFVGLNLLVEYTVGGRLRLHGAPLAWFIQTAEEVFLYGSPRAAFDILVSIAYFLLLTPIVLTVSKHFKLPLWLIAAMAVMGMVVADYQGESNPILEMLSVALLGLAAGARGIAGPQSMRAMSSVFVAYGLYIVATAAWNIPFVLQVVGVCVSLLMLHVGATVVGTRGFVQRLVVRLGEYSLLSYIAQIVMLQLLFRMLRGTPLHGISLLVPFLIAVLAIIALAELCAFARQRSPMTNRAYLLVFG